MMHLPNVDNRNQHCFMNNAHVHAHVIFFENNAFNEKVIDLCTFLLNSITSDYYICLY